MKMFLLLVSFNSLEGSPAFLPFSLEMCPFWVNCWNQQFQLKDLPFQPFTLHLCHAFMHIAWPRYEHFQGNGTFSGPAGNWVSGLKQQFSIPPPPPPSRFSLQTEMYKYSSCRPHPFRAPYWSPGDKKKSAKNRLAKDACLINESDLLYFIAYSVINHKNLIFFFSYLAARLSRLLCFYSHIFSCHGSLTLSVACVFLPASH